MGELRVAGSSVVTALLSRESLMYQLAKTQMGRAASSGASLLLDGARKRPAIPL